MDLSKGYWLDQPSLVVPWDITWSDLQKLLAGWNSARFHEGDRQGRQRLACLRCASLGHLWHDMQIRFSDDHLWLFELRFLEGSMDARGIIDFDRSFPPFQRHLEATFGPPALLRAGSPQSQSPEVRFPEYEWRVDDVHIRHAIREHWGPVEDLTIQRHTLRSNTCANRSETRL